MTNEEPGAEIQVFLKQFIYLKEAPQYQTTQYYILFRYYTI